ncbi:MAG: BatD family protein, partial [Flammeovirgaceae bacterium]
FFGQNRQEDFKTFYSKPRTVRVKELPPHPLRNQVAVGEYQLQEKIASNQLETGQSVLYDFSIFGEGNISAIEKPKIENNSSFDFYEPNVKQSINRDNGRVTGTKSFSYFMIPKEPGTFAMKDYFKWVFFNPKKKKYDTLQSQQVISVIGESQKNQSIESNDLGSFYDRADATDNQLRSMSDLNWVKVSLNGLAALLFIAALYLVFKKYP